MRYKKTVTENDSVTATYDYVYSDGTLILLTYTDSTGSNTARFIYDSFGEPRGFMLNDTAVYLYIKNVQGDITGIVDENGNVLLAYSYTAWGNVTYSATNMENLALAVTLSNVNPFTYRGYCYDYDISMYYLQSRYYDPTICRFINADSTDYLGATGTLLSYNLFAYCENDGVDFVDETGNLAYAFFKITTRTSTIKSYAKSMFTSKANQKLFKMGYLTYYTYDSNLRPYKYKVPLYIYQKTKLSYSKQRVQVFFGHRNNSKNRVVGTFYFRTIIEWMLYIEARHMTTFTKMKKTLLKKYGISEDNYDIFMHALSDTVAGTPFEAPVMVYSIVELVFDEISKYRDKVDNYIIGLMNILKNEKGSNADLYYIMLSWSTAYQIYKLTSKGFAWVNTSYKNVKNCL